MVNFASPSRLEQSHTIEEMQLKVVKGEPRGKAQLLMARLIDTSANSQALLNANRIQPKQQKSAVQNDTTKSDRTTPDEKVWCPQNTHLHVASLSM